MSINQQSSQTAAQPLTVEQLEQAIKELPKHRTDLIKDARNSIAYAKRGLIKDNAPFWRQIQNVIFVSKINSDSGDAGDE